MRAPQQLPQLQSTPSFQSVAASPFPSANMLAPNMSNLKAPVAGAAMGAPMKEVSSIGLNVILWRHSSFNYYNEMHLL